MKKGVDYLRFTLTVVIPEYAAADTLAEMLRDLAQDMAEEGSLVVMSAEQRDAPPGSERTFAILTSPDGADAGLYTCWPEEEECGEP